MPVYVELQLSSSAFCKIVRNNLRRIELCDLIGKEYSGLLLDHIEVLEKSQLRRYEMEKGKRANTQVFSMQQPGFNTSTWAVPYMQIVQTVVIHFVTPDVLEANGVNPSATTIPVEKDLVLNVSMVLPEPASHDRRPALLCSLNQDSLEPLQANSVNASIRIPIDLQPLNDALDRKEPIEPLNAGITCDGDKGTFVVVRIDIDLKETGPDVTSAFFINEAHQSFLANCDWALLVDRNLICSEAKRKLVAGLIKHPEKLKYDGNVSASWFTVPPRVGVSCDAVFLVSGGTGLDISLTITLMFSLSPFVADCLVTTYSIDAEPTGNTSLLQWVGLPLAGEAGWSMITEFVWELAVKPALDLSSDAMNSMGSGVDCKEKDKKTFECQKVVSITLSPYPAHWVKLSIDMVDGINRGLVIGGAIAGLKELLPLQGSVTATEFGWNVDGDCKLGHRIVNNAEIEIGGDAHLCPPEPDRAKILDDPVGEFVLSWVPTAPQKLTVNPQFKADYTGLIHKYPCKVRVVTSVGLRTITFAPPEPITDEVRDYLQKQIGWLKKVCQIWQDSITVPTEIVIGPPGPMEGPDWRQEIVQAVTVASALAVLVGLPFEFNQAIATAIGPNAAGALKLAAVPLGLAGLGAYAIARLGGRNVRRGNDER